MDFSPRSHRRSAWPPGTVSRGPRGGGVPREGLAPQLSLLPPPTRGLTVPGLPQRCVTPLPAPFRRPEPLPRVCGKRARTPDPHRGHRHPQHPADPAGQQDTVHWGQVWDWLAECAESEEHVVAVWRFCVAGPVVCNVNVCPWGGTLKGAEL